MYLSIITILLLGSVAFGFFGRESEVCILKLWLLFFLLFIIFAIICGFAYLAYLLWLSFKYNYSTNLLFNIINLFIYLFISYIIYTVYYKSNNIFNKENHKKICDFFLLNPFVSNHKILKNDISIFSSSNFKSWFVSSIFIIIFIIGISYFNSSYLVPAVNSFHIYIQLGFLAFALVLLLIYKSKIFSFFNIKNILNKFLFFLYVFSLRFILIYIATDFLGLIDIELSKFILLILTTEGFFFLFKPVLCEYLGLFSSMLVNLLTNLNLYFQTLPDFITSVKQLVIGLINYRYINVRIKPFCTRITNGNKLSVNIELGVLSMFNKPYFPSFFQPLSLPFVCPSISTIMQGNIFKSLVLLILQPEGETRVYSWNGETIVVSDWDGQTIVGSDWENETVVGSENNLDLKVCLDSCASSKLRDPQLNFSLEYLNENRVQSVFVNKGKGIATNLDLNSDSVENSQNLAQDIGSNEVADMSDDNINIAINESIQTNQYSLRIGESSSRGAIGLFGQSNNICHSSSSSSSLTTMDNADLYELGSELGFYTSDIVNLDLQSSSDSDLDSDLQSSSDSDLDSDESYYYDYTTDRCEEELISYMETINLNHLFNVYSFFKNNSGQDESLDFNENVNEDIYDLNVSDLDSDQESLDTHQENLYSDITVQRRHGMLEETNLPSEEVLADYSMVKSEESNNISKRIKVHKNKFSELLYLLRIRKGVITRAIKSSKLFDNKDIRLDCLRDSCESIRQDIRVNKDKEKILEGIKPKIDNLPKIILGTKLKVGETYANKFMENKKDIFHTIGKVKQTITTRIEKSKVDDKDTQIKIVHKKIEKLKSIVRSDTSSTIDYIKSKVNRTLLKLKLDFYDTSKWTRAFTSKVNVRTSAPDNDFYILSKLYQKIKYNLMSKVSSRIRYRILKAPILNKDVVLSDFYSELDKLRIEMYKTSNVKDSLHLILKKLIAFNTRYFYENVTLHSFYRLNYRIITTLKQCIKYIDELKK